MTMQLYWLRCAPASRARLPGGSTIERGMTYWHVSAPRMIRECPGSCYHNAAVTLTHFLGVCRLRVTAPEECE